MSAMPARELYLSDGPRDEVNAADFLIGSR